VLLTILSNITSLTASKRPAHSYFLALAAWDLSTFEFDHMLKLGIIQPSSSSESLPVYMASKIVPGDRRPCEDFRALNKVILPDRYPIPHHQIFTATLQKAKIFSLIDLVRAYHQILLALEDVPKTALSTPFELFEFLRMLFGL